ncbi:hypothetical protein B0J14DRAFT_694941 [Halenospora varia]|nr:hypothetical protein B0J14DRAFT_694941 [Halenospora varia]
MPEVNPAGESNVPLGNQEDATPALYPPSSHLPRGQTPQSSNEDVGNISSAYRDYDGYAQSSPWTSSVSFHTHPFQDSYLTPSQNYSIVEGGESGGMDSFGNGEARSALGSPWEPSFDLTDWMALDTSDMRDDDFGMLQASQALMASVPVQSRSDAVVLTPVSAKSPPSNDLGSKDYPPRLAGGGARLTFKTGSSKQNEQQQRQQHRQTASMNERIRRSVDLEVRQFTTLSPPPVTKQWPTDWNPAKIDNLVSFPQMKSVEMDLYEAENFAHIPPLDHNTYESMAHCLRQTNQEQSSDRPLYLQAVLEALAHRNPISYKLGVFARFIVVHAVYRNVWDMLQYASMPFFPPVCSDSELEWNAMVLDSLNALKPTSDDSPYPQSPLHFGLELHANLVALLLYTPSVELLLFARSQLSSQEVQEAHCRLTAWIQELNGQTARRAVMHASILFGLIQAKHGRSTTFHEPVVFLIATLTLWTFSHFSSGQSPIYNNGDIDGSRSSYTTTIRLDRIRSDEDVKAWIEGGGDSRGFLVDVGNVNGRDAENRLLVVAQNTLLGMETWALAQGFASVLSSLQNRSSARRRGEE